MSVDEASFDLARDCRVSKGIYDDIGGKVWSMDSSSGVNVGRIGESMCWEMML